MHAEDMKKENVIPPPTVFVGCKSIIGCTTLCIAVCVGLFLEAADSTGRPSMLVPCTQLYAISGQHIVS